MDTILFYRWNAHGEIHIDLDMPNIRPTLGKPDIYQLDGQEHQRRHSSSQWPDIIGINPIGLGINSSF